MNKDDKHKRRENSFRNGGKIVRHVKILFSFARGMCRRRIFLCRRMKINTKRKIPPRRKVSRISVVSILVTDRNAAEKVNGALSLYGGYIIGRMGIPYKEKNVSVLSVALDAPVEITNALTGKLGKIEGVSVKALFGKI